MLRIELDVSFSLLGISCHLKDYRFAWTLNHTLRTNFFKTTPYISYDSKAEFSRYQHLSDSDEILVFSNKSQDGFLVSKKKQVDYWLLLQKEVDKQDVQHYARLIQQSEYVLAVFEENDRKTKEQFVY
ncbi:IPExxxVDY family protein [Flavobacteriales bacterium]|nr:IPExxxVDY family protein [Flavobacteriales bacterium]